VTDVLSGSLILGAVPNVTFKKWPGAGFG